MSSHDGARNHEDAYCPLSAAAAELASPLAHTSASVPPPASMLMGTQFVQSPQQTLHQHQPAQYNEYFYNLYASSPGQPETYSVLPVGHGNFLKVYHCPENAPTGLHNDNNSGPLYHPQTQPQPSHFQQQPVYHLPPPQPAPPQQFFNSYELFSSNTLMPTPDNQPILGREMKSSQTTQTQQAPLFMLSNHDEAMGPHTSSTNTIIKKIVNNLSPKMAGIPIQQTTVPTTPIARTEYTASTPIKQTLDTSGSVQSFGTSLQTPMPLNNSNNLPHQQTTVLPAPQTPPPNEMPIANNIPNETPQLLTSASSSMNLSSSALTAINTTPEVKKRIVAEVKPMRMSYSDVLSKMNNQQLASTQSISTKQATNKNGKTTLLNERKADNKCNLDGTNGAASGNRRTDEPGRSNKKSPTHENKENVQQPQGSNGKNNRRIGNNNTPINNNSATHNNSHLKQTQKPNLKSNTADLSGTNSNNNKKRQGCKRQDADSTKTDSNNGTKSQKMGNATSEKDFNGFYNVTAKNSDNLERSNKSASSSYTTTSNNSASNVNSRKTTSKTTSYSSASSFGSNQSRARYSNSASNSSYSYSSKRGRSGNFSYNNSTAMSTNKNYELAKKFLRTWLEYTIKILTWLFYLVYDIVVLGFSMVCERLAHGYECGIVYARHLYRDLKQNSNKPSIWLKNYWRRFDARFKKNSIWAFWRRFYKKKPPEQTSENFKCGRLPQTGEEAMFSLLNCKGKDAYSILGVPPDSSQEQIRKHYKKIAVLVHPDKNKQAGAEEAFKVLQRAFELIGEPEKRLVYDQSLAEALHAEKAWTELHDLLSQLQTKITEAANTIRCSTCGLRHPRRLTDRPHYAARECASCKIRHSAREGDIWAETSLLGLRWKYLALMEGKVYDITEWANCQKGALSHLEPNSHMVQYRIVRGAQQQQQQQQQAQQQAHQHHSPHHQGQQPYTQHPGAHHERSSSGKFKRTVPPSEASLHEFLDNLYSGHNPNTAGNTTFSNSSRRRTRRN